MDLTAAQADCLIFTFKEGLLSAVAHDLKLRVTSFTFRVDAEQGTVDATFDAGSIRVVCAMKDGADDPTTLSDGDKRKIEQSMQQDVLDVKRHPLVRFVVNSPAQDGRYTGQLTLKGVTKPLSFTVREVGQRRVAEVTLNQPDFGIKPYSAMMGALKVKAALKVQLSIPWPLPA